MKKSDMLSLIYSLLSPVLLMVLGVILLVRPDSASVLAAKILGWVLLATGIGFGIAAFAAPYGIGGKVLSALVCFALGGWLLKNPLLLAAGIGRFVGILLAVRGIRDIFGASQRHRGMLLAVITTALGAILIAMPMTTSRVVVGACGLIVLVVGIAMFIDRLRENRRLNPPDDPNIIDAL